MGHGWAHRGRADSRRGSAAGVAALAGLLLGATTLTGCVTVVQDRLDDRARAPGSGPTISSTPAPTAEWPTPVQRGQVTHVVDGDTLDVSGVGRIRVIGIDTPERGECGFESATLAMAALVNGRWVTVVPGAQDDADHYGRLLRYVDVGSVDSGLELIEQGWAIARYDSRDGYGHHTREETYVAADVASEDLGCYPD